MQHVGKVLGLLGFALAHPVSAAAQSFKLADLVGTWEGVPTLDSTLLVDTIGIKHTLTIQADGTWKDACTKKDGKYAQCSMGGMFMKIKRISGDSLLTDGGTPFKVTLDNKQLSLASFGTKPFQVYERVESPKKP